MGKGEAKEFICTTYGHELRGGLLEAIGVLGRGVQRGNNWDNYSSIIYKIYLKKEIILSLRQLCYIFIGKVDN